MIIIVKNRTPDRIEIFLIHRNKSDFSTFKTLNYKTRFQVIPMIAVMIMKKKIKELGWEYLKTLVEILQLGIFWVGIIRGDLLGGSLIGGNFSGGSFPDTIKSNYHCRRNYCKDK